MLFLKIYIFAIGVPAKQTLVEKYHFAINFDWCVTFIRMNYFRAWVKWLWAMTECKKQKLNCGKIGILRVPRLKC
jgi:hypothetical protein